MSIIESSITNPKKQAEFWKCLSEQKDVEIKQLKQEKENLIEYLEEQWKCFCDMNEMGCFDAVIEELEIILEKVKDGKYE